MLEAATNLPSFESTYNVQSQVINASDVVSSEVDDATINWDEFNAMLESGADIGNDMLTGQGLKA